ncbi:MAG: NADH-quinone oxidoreductase subunit NuoG [Alphaproteobacteria bacterium]|nr:NADH-quinone oxidoreductase subunit NuoG [Alphaproteobacteria bacterium]
MPKLTINGREIEVEPDTSVLQACERLGIEIPRFCYHEKLTVAGNCRMCLVEIEKTPKPVASCAMPCADGMVVRTDTPMVQKARKDVMELLLLNHPLDCPVCDQGGECDLQDEAFAYGGDRGCTKEKRRLVDDKELGPLIKTVMTRCIHCTRCIRFAGEIAGTPALGGLFRGENMEIDTGTGKPLTSELSGNLADVCPVGALTSKPFAFTYRPWELQHTDGIDVMDAVGSNIRIDSCGSKVVRILPRRNDAINEEWISDKTRYACDGLGFRRLDRPYVRENGKLRPASREEALAVIADRLKGVAPERIAALAGDLVDCESLFALKTLMKALGSPHLDCRQDGAVYDVSSRAAYIMNTTIAGIEKADAILLIGANPRHEAPLVNARIRKSWRQNGLPVGLIGAPDDLSYPYDHIGSSPGILRDIIKGKPAFAKVLREAQNPMLILGAGALARPDGAAIHALARETAETCNMIRLDWNGFNVLQLAAARTAALDFGFVPQAYGLATNGVLQAASGGEMDAVYLLGADEIDTARLGNAFVIYQGHHGDKGAERAGVILPGAAYTEKDGTYVNTEGRPQQSRKAVSSPGEAREDWAIVCAVADALGKSLPFDSLASLRAEMNEACPAMAAIGQIAKAEWKAFGKTGKVSSDAFAPVINNFYMTDPVSRASPTMAACTEEIWPFVRKEPQ